MTKNLRVDFPNRLDALDGLRGIAALIIALFFHYKKFLPGVSIDEFPLSGIFEYLYKDGAICVELFFMMSGFIFFRFYFQKVSEHKIKVESFFGKRIVRLFPLYLITSAVVVIIQKIIDIFMNTYFNTQFPADIKHKVLNLFGLGFGWLDNQVYPYNPPAWSISVELLLYIIFFVLVWFAGKNKDKLYSVMLGLIALGVVAIHFSWSYPMVNRETGRGLACFFIGCLVSKADEVINKYHISVFKKLIWIASTLLILFAFHDYNLAYVLVIFPSVILLTLNLFTANKVLSSKPLVYLGKISYSIYMWHYPVMAALWFLSKQFGLLDFRTPLALAVYTLVLLAVSVVSYHAIEKPLSKLFGKIFVKDSIKWEDEIAL